MKVRYTAKKHAESIEFKLKWYGVWDTTKKQFVKNFVTPNKCQAEHFADILNNKEK